ncbi:MAG: ribosomal protein S18-alanine N-acetyltransferase [Gallionella sp.]|nr:ribosomal protein S18-alanine N-acetyltransferase [Gallionella sp.]
MIRDMTAADVNAVLAIEQSVQPYPWTLGNFNDALQAGYVARVVVNDGVIQGFMVWYPLPDEAELLNIGVAEAYQRQGVARALLADMVITARTQARQRVFLEVRVSNVPAITLYCRTGFAVAGERRNYYKNAQGSENALVMVCELKGAGDE